MYESSLDPTELRQGDVIDKIYLPRLEINSARFLHQLTAEGELTFGGNLQTKSTLCKAVILSQCCEFNESKRDSFTLAEIVSLTQFVDEIALAFNVAELRPVSDTRLKKENREGLLATNIIDAENLNSNRLVNCYIYDVDGQHFSEPHVLDFTRITSISMKDQKYVLRSKIKQLDNEHRLQLKQKLAYFFSRPD